MTVPSSSHSTPFRGTGSRPRVSGGRRQALGGLLIAPVILLAACLSPRQVRALTDAENVD